MHAQISLPEAFHLAEEPCQLEHAYWDKAVDVGLI